MGMPFPQSLSDVVLGDAVKHKNLTIVPLFGPSTGPQVATLAEALIKNDAEVTEVSEAGNVNQLLVLNKGLQQLLLIDGEELIGAKQNRILNTTIVCAAESQTLVPVSCVERGRWAHRSRSFSSANHTMPASMRKSKTERVARSLIGHRGYDADQMETWREIDDYSTRRGVDSSTSAMSDVMDRDTSCIEDYVGAITPRPKQTGMAVYLNGRLLGVDLVGSPECYAALHEQILRGYAADALEHSQDGANDDCCTNAKDFLMRIEHSHMTSHQPPGVGRNLQFDTQELTASALLVDGEMVHMSAYPKVAA
jgi:hypothetical protein